MKKEKLKWLCIDSGRNLDIPRNFNFCLKPNILFHAAAKV